MDKLVVKYVEVFLYPGDTEVLGNPVFLQREDHAGTYNWARTSRVIAYDETMEIIETENTVYVPA